MKLNELFQVMNLDLADTNAKERELRSKVVAKLIELVEEEKSVPKKAYQEVSGDMHKYKSELKETKERLAEIQENKGEENE